MIDLKKAITALVKNEVEFIVVGGVAVRLHSSAYLTEDLDFCYSRTSSNISRLVSALKAFAPLARGMPPELPFFFDERTLKNGTNFTLQTTIGDIDLLGEVKGIGTYSDALLRSETYDIYGTTIHALNLNALIASKEATDRPKDRLVLPELYALREALDPDED